MDMDVVYECTMSKAKAANKKEGQKAEQKKI